MMQRPGTSLAKVFVFLLALGLAGSAAAQAPAYPSRPIKIISPFAPGGQNDFLSRAVGQKLSELWGQPVLIENRGGAGGTIGVDMVAKAPPDGYTLAMGGSSNLTVAPGLYAKLPYDPVRDLTPVVNVAFVTYVLTTNAKLPVSNVRDLIDLAKSRKGLLSYGSAGVGSMAHLAGELFKSMTGTDILHVPYKGAAPYVTAILAGQIDMLFTDWAAVAPYVKSGKLRLIAATSSKRAATVPQLPTIAEAGLEGYAVETWHGIVAPTGTPRDIVDKLNSATVNVLKAADVRQRFQQLGYEAIGDTPEHFGETIRAEIEKFARVVKTANIKQQ